MNERVLAFVKAALDEDVGRGDLFTRLGINPRIKAEVRSKSKGVLAGALYGRALLEWQGVEGEWRLEDGREVDQGSVIVTLTGDAQQILALERTLLNLLQHASGIATHAARLAKLLEGSRMALLDTRKTRPLLREFEKYAARVGGVRNHRMGLDDCLMLKDTHLALLDDLEGAILRARATIPFTARIEVECECVAQAECAMRAGADIVMCDNMAHSEVCEVVALRNAHYPRVLLEASGNVDEARLKMLASSGVDAVSAGGVIHQAVWLDFHMKVESL